MQTPATMVLLVSAGSATPTEHEVTPEWVRVGGTEECGGPHEAEIVVPAP